MNRPDALRQELAPTVERLLRRCSEDSPLRQTVQAAANTFIEALIEAHPAGAGGPLRPYVTRCLSRFVSALIEALSEETESRIAPTLGGHSGDRQARPLASPIWETAEEAEPSPNRHWLPEALACLDAKARQMLIWNYYEERSVAQIAAWLETTEAAVRGGLSGALAILRQEMPEAAGIQEIRGGAISFAS